MDAPRLCDECGAPRPEGGGRCARCGATPADEAPRAAAIATPATEAAWRSIGRATVAFAVVQQATQWLAVAHAPSAWGVARALLTLAVTALAGWRLARRDEAALVLWSWVMVASVGAMALTFAATMRWMPLRGFDLGLTVWAWATVVVYATRLWGCRRVVLAGAVG